MHSRNHRCLSHLRSDVIHWRRCLVDGSLSSIDTWASDKAVGGFICSAEYDVAILLLGFAQKPGEPTRQLIGFLGASNAKSQSMLL